VDAVENFGVLRVLALGLDLDIAKAAEGFGPFFDLFVDNLAKVIPEFIEDCRVFLLQIIEI